MKFLTFLLFLTLLLACDNKSEEASPRSSSMMLSLPAKEKSEDASGNDGAVATEEVASAMNASPEVIEQKIIHEGNLRFETDDLTETYNTIMAAVKKHRGIIQNDIEGKDYESLFRNITVRIPAAHFDGFLTDAGKGVAYFDRKEISSRDVTEEYIDIDARLKTKKVLEARYLDLLKKAVKISEILEIEKQLSAIREEIESKEGQLKYMQSRISMSTVNIEFYKKVAVEGGATVSYGSKMWNAIKSGFNSISTFFIGLLYLWPFIIILVFLVFWLRRRWKRKKTV